MHIQLRLKNKEKEVDDCDQRLSHVAQISSFGGNRLNRVSVHVSHSALGQQDSLYYQIMSGVRQNMEVHKKFGKDARCTWREKGWEPLSYVESKQKSISI